MYLTFKPAFMTTDTRNVFEVFYWVLSVCTLIATVYYIATGPITAIKIGRELNNEQQKDNAKRSLFLLLFALRGSPLNHDFVRGLNQIVVVFEDVPVVLEAWRNHLKDLNNKKGLADPPKTWELGRVELLSQMAYYLGYKRLVQTDIMKDYYPEGHETQIIEDLQVRSDFVTFLKKSTELNSLLIDQLQKNNPPPQPEILS